jgi:hypothetical protein
LDHGRRQSSICVLTIENQDFPDKKRQFHHYIPYHLAIEHHLKTTHLEQDVSTGIALCALRMALLRLDFDAILCLAMWRPWQSPPLEGIAILGS